MKKVVKKLMNLSMTLREEKLPNTLQPKYLSMHEKSIEQNIESLRFVNGQ
ncbi:hypothetical protein [Enterococcus villorum]